MTKLMSALLISLFVLIGLLACSPAPEPAPTVTPVPPSPTLEPTTVPEMAALEVELSNVTNVTDYALIGRTGRPQFLNSFATW